MANSAPYTPSKPVVLSNMFDIYPDFQWLSVGDPDLSTGSSQGISYNVEVLVPNDEGEFLTPLHVNPVPGVDQVSAAINYSWMSGLVEGSYMVRVQANDGELTSDWSEGAIFKIRPLKISLDKVIVVAPEYFDPTLGKPYFWSKDTMSAYKKAQKTAENTVGA